MKYLYLIFILIGIYFILEEGYLYNSYTKQRDVHYIVTNSTTAYKAELKVVK